MPEEIKVEEIQSLIDQINQLEQKVTGKGEAARVCLQNFTIDKILQTGNLLDQGKVKAEDWKNLGEIDKGLYRDRLVHALDFLRNLAEEDGPEDAGHIMYNEYASNATILGLLIFGMIVMGLLIFFIITNWEDATRGQTPTQANGKQTGESTLNKETTPTDKPNTNTNQQPSTDPAGAAPKPTPSTDPAGAAPILTPPLDPDGTNPTTTDVSEKSILLMVMLLGALGGMLQYLSSLSKYIGNRRLKRSWVVYYLTIPFIGAGLAPVTYLLLRVGVLSPGTHVNGGGSTTSYMNLNGIYAFAVLTGMFAKSATAKLSEVFQTIFNTKEPPTRDPLGGDQKEDK